MNTIKTDSADVTLELGQHIPASEFDGAGKRVCHCGFLPLAQSSKALVDVTNRRIVWLSRNRMTWDSRICGGKIKAAIKAYEAHYSVRLRPGCDAPGTDMSGLPLAGLTVSGGIVTSHVHTTQKCTYVWDWSAMRQVKSKHGWKY